MAEKVSVEGYYFFGSFVSLEEKLTWSSFGIITSIEAKYQGRRVEEGKQAVIY